MNTQIISMYWLTTLLTAYIVVIISSRLIVGDDEHKVSDAAGATTFIDFYHFRVSLLTLFKMKCRLNRYIKYTSVYSVGCRVFTFGYINVTTTEFLMRKSTSTPWVTSVNCIYKQHSSCTARSSFFTERIVNIWSSLPADRHKLFITSRFYSTEKQDGFSRV